MMTLEMPREPSGTFERPDDSDVWRSGVTGGWILGTEKGSDGEFEEWSRGASAEELADAAS
jgi:hypothetical protein